MEGLIRLINHSTNSSVRGFIRWMEILSYPRAGFPEFERALAPFNSTSFLQDFKDFDNDSNGDDPDKWAGFLWATPKKRTSIMKRLRRKFGHEDWGSPLLKPKTNLRICDTCGHHYEAFHLCGNCYARIKKETELIRKQAEVQFGHGPEDKKFVVLYETEKESFNKESGGGTKLSEDMIVEIPKPRPTWFSGSLQQRSTLRINPDAKSIAPVAPTPTIQPNSNSSKES